MLNKINPADVSFDQQISLEKKKKNQGKRRQNSLLVSIHPASTGR